MNPTHSVAQAATAKMAQGVVNDAIQAKRFITGLAEFHGVQTLDSVRCNGLPAYTPGAARDILRDGTADAPVPDGMQCTLNFWWLDLFTAPTISSGVSRARVRDLSNHFFSTPGAWPSAFKLEVEVPDGKLPHEVAGSITAISPIEMVWAALFGWMELLRNAPSGEEKQQIKDAMLTVEVRIKRRDPVDMTLNTLWSAHNVRESIVTLGDAIRRTPCQRLLDLMHAKELLEKKTGESLGAERCAALWNENVTLHPGAEPVKASYVDAVFTVHNRLLSMPRVADALLTADSDGTSAFDSVYKMDAVIKRCGSPQCIAFVTLGLLDAVLKGVVTPGELSLRNLTGRGLPGGKGLLDTMVAKYELADKLFTHAVSLSLQPALMVKVQEWSTGVDMYRQNMVNRAWVATLLPSAQTFVSLWEDYVVANKMDVVLKQQKLNGGAVADLLSRDPLKPFLDKLLQELDDEGCKKPSSSPDKKDSLLTVDEALNTGDSSAPAGNSSRQEPAMDDSRIRPWVEYAENLFDKHVTLTVDTGSQEPLVACTHSSTQQHTRTHARTHARNNKHTLTAHARTQHDARTHTHARNNGVHASTQNAREDALIDAIMASGLQQLATDLKTAKDALSFDKEKTGSIIVLYDCKAAGQSSSRPHINVCPFRQDHHVRSIKAALLGLQGTKDITQLAIPDAAVFLQFDGYKHGSEMTMLRSFSNCDGKTLEKKSKHLFVTSDFSAATSGKAKLQGIATVPSVEFAHAITRTTLALPERKQMHGSVGATNSSDMLGPFPRVAADAASRFNCLHKEKAKLYGNGIIAAGGSVSGDPGEVASPSPVGNDRVPFNYHEMHIKVYEDLTQYFCARACIDLTCSDGVAIIHAVRQRHAYLGVCFTEDHKKALRKYVVNRLFQSFQTPGDPLFNSEMVGDITGSHTPSPAPGALANGAAAPGAVGGAPPPVPLPAPPAPAAGVAAGGGTAATVKDGLMQRLAQLNEH